jgi:hypothetical protein
MLAFDLLRMGFAHRVLRGIAIALVGTPAIGVKAGDAKRFEQGFQLQKHRILTPAKDIGQDFSRVVIDRMPEPALLRFLPNDTPHLINFCFFHFVDLYEDLAWIHVLEGPIVDMLPLRLFFLIRQ